MRILPVYKGYTVDARLKQFRKFPIGEMGEFIDFDSPEGDTLLNEMVEQGLGLEPMEHDTPLGRQYFKDLTIATHGKKAWEEYLKHEHEQQERNKEAA